MFGPAGVAGGVQYEATHNLSVDIPFYVYRSIELRVKLRIHLSFQLSCLDFAF